MRRFLAAMLVASFALASASLADDPKPDATKGDLAKIQGKWTGKVGPDKNFPITLDFKGTSATILFTVNGEDITLKADFKLDETKTPKQLDWAKFTTPDGNEVEPNLAIYKFDGEALVLCSGGPGNERPKDFVEGEGGPPNLTKFEKVK